MSGFSLTPYLESFTPTLGLRTPVFPRISSNLHCGTPTFSKRCLWDSYFQNPSENPECIPKRFEFDKSILGKRDTIKSCFFDCSLPAIWFRFDKVSLLKIH